MLLKRVVRTETMRIPLSDPLSSMCHVSKNLYNTTNYMMRQEFFHEKRVKTTNYDMNHALKDDLNFMVLPSQTAQQTIGMVYRNWKSFFRSLKEYRKVPSKFTGRPKIPKYLKKNGEYLLLFSNQQCRITRSGILKFPKKMSLEIRTRFDHTLDLREVRIIPRGVGYDIQIIYRKEVYVDEKENMNPKRIMGIDIGVRNLVTIANNFSEQGIAVRAGPLRSMNARFNMIVSSLMSVYDRQDDERNSEMKLKRITDSRNFWMKDMMHKISTWIVNYMSSLNVYAVAIGRNPGWKQNVRMGKRNNRIFVQIPFATLISQIQYKAEEKGIAVILTEEDHTSKCSFLDTEEIRHHAEYKGKRVSRGIFRSSNGTLINADLNAAYKIIKRVFPDAFADGIRGAGLHPVGLSMKDMINPQ